MNQVRQFVAVTLLLLMVIAKGASGSDLGVGDLRSRAEQGDAHAQRELGARYMLGFLGVPRDYAEAAKWLRKAADQGIAEAQTNLGNLYLEGHGVSQDDREAAKLYQKAAEQGYASGQKKLGNMYHDGTGVTPDYAAAMEWYRKAAEQWDYDAAFNLGIMHYNGEGVAQDYVQAHMWFNVAAVLSSNMNGRVMDSEPRERAVKARGMVAKLMTHAQIGEAQELARKWMESHPPFKGR